MIFTLLRRFLRHQGLDAKLVINVTDINDKIYDAAREAGEPSDEYAKEMTAAYIADTDALGLGARTRSRWPRRRSPRSSP